jgi:hypothetical protein
MILLRPVGLRGTSASYAGNYDATGLMELQAPTALVISGQAHEVGLRTEAQVPTARFPSDLGSTLIPGVLPCGSPAFAALCPQNAMAQDQQIADERRPARFQDQTARRGRRASTSGDSEFVRRLAQPLYDNPCRAIVEATAPLKRDSFARHARPGGATPAIVPGGGRLRQLSDETGVFP